MQTYIFKYENGSVVPQDWTVDRGDIFPLARGGAQSNQQPFDLGAEVPVTVTIPGIEWPANTTMTLGAKGWTMPFSPYFILSQTGENVTLNCTYDGKPG